jgi:hypothetical protein
MQLLSVFLILPTNVVIMFVQELLAKKFQNQLVLQNLASQFNATPQLETAIILLLIATMETNVTPANYAMLILEPVLLNSQSSVLPIIVTRERAILSPEPVSPQPLIATMELIVLLIAAMSRLVA